MSKRISNTVDRAIKKLYARMAAVAAKRALTHIEYDRIGAADHCAVCVERYLKKAGAQATDWYFNV